MLSEPPERTPFEIVNDAIKLHGITHLYVGFSGGKDSSVVADFIAEYFPEFFGGCLFCDTGIAVEESKKFVIDCCKERKWRLFITHPDRTYEQIVTEVGFPGPAVHNFIMRYLKYIPMRKLIYKWYEMGRKPAIISGVRKQESVRRGINASDEVYTDGKMIFVSPMLYKSDGWMYAYYFDHKLKRSPVYDTLHISGDCLCGCYSKPGEAKLIQIFHKRAAKFIKYLEDKVKTIRGPNGSNSFSTWGKQAGMTHAEEQQTLDYFNEQYQQLMKMAENDPIDVNVESIVCNDCMITQPNESNQIEKDIAELDEKLDSISK